MDRRMLRLLLTRLQPSAAIALTPIAAHADGPTVTITVGAAATLLDPTLVRVPVEITCTPLVVSFDQGSGADLRQAVSGRIAFGTGSEESTIICDGTPHPNSYLVWVSTSSPAPFRQGNATVSIGAYLCSATFICESGGAGGWRVLPEM